MRKLIVMCAARFIALSARSGQHFAYRLRKERHPAIEMRFFHPQMGVMRIRRAALVALRPEQGMAPEIGNDRHVGFKLGPARNIGPSRSSARHRS
jgi:hypothetical protein